MYSREQMYNVHRPELYPITFCEDMSDKNIYDKMQFLRSAALQDEQVYAAYEIARHTDVEWVVVECDTYMDHWLNVRDISGAAVLEAFRVLTIQGHENIPEPPQPPGTWTPPSKSGIVCKRDGGFFMSGLRVPDGLLLGTYQYAQQAHIVHWDWSFSTQFSAPIESAYMLHMTPTGPVCSTECPAGVLEWEGGWKWVFKRPEPKSLAFDILPFQGGLLLFTKENVDSHNIRLYRGDINGLNWTPWKDFTGHFVQCCTDGGTVYLIGEQDGLPCIIDHNGKQILKDSTYKGQIINYAVVKSGLFTLGLNNIGDIIHEPSGDKRRNGYVTYFDGKNHIEAIDCVPPWIMNIKIAPDGSRFAIASIWNETGYPNPELVWSFNGYKPWKKIADIPMPSVQTIEIADGGVYCYGGEYNSYGAVYFHKLGA